MQQARLYRVERTPMKVVCQSVRPVRAFPKRPAKIQLPSILQPSQTPVQSTLLRPQEQQQMQQQQHQGGLLQKPSFSQEVIALVALSTAVSFICSIDRAAMSVTILPMSEQFAWDDSIKGAISSAFFAGYMVTNLCGGFLATRFSSKGVLALGVVLWSCFTIATPSAAASGSLGTLILARSAMGVGEGVTYPSIQNLVRRWVPESSRSRALAFIYSGHQLGTIASYLLAPLLIAQFGWPSVFWIFGSLGFFWLLGWVPLVKNDPSQVHTGVKSTAAAVAAAPEPPLRVQDVPWGQFFTNPAFWAIVSAQVTASVGNCLSFSWLPTFYNQVYGVDVMQSSAFTIIPFVATVAATNASGWIADGLVNNQILDKTSTRKLMQAIASFGPAIVLLKLAGDQAGGVGSHSLTDAVAMITVWLALCGFSAAGYASNPQDISSKYSGILFGLSNGLASIAGSVSIYLTGQVLHTTHDWGLVFEAAAGCYVVGAVAYLKWASCQEQFGGEEPLQGKAKRG